MAEPPILIAAATRPYPSETENGDTWRVDWQDSGCRIAVVDGLGHGPEAAEAAARAVDALAAAPTAGPLDALRGCHDALRGTRGAAMSVVAIELAAARITYAGVGNVEARLRAGGRAERLVSMRGIVGAVLPRLRAFDRPLPPDWLLLIHTDGVRDRFELDDVSATSSPSLSQLARQLLASWARPTDDATVVVASPRPTP